MALGLAVSSLCQVLSRVVTNRHKEALRAAVFLDHYRRCRLEEAALVGGAGSADHVSAYAAALPGGGAVAVPDAGTGAASAARLGVALAAPPTLPRHVLAREVLYNVGRAAHQVSMLPLAAHAYGACLATAPPPGFYDELSGLEASSSSSGGSADIDAGSAGSGSSDALSPSSVAPAAAAAARRDAHVRLRAVFEGALNTQREAAFNLTLLLRRAGNAATPGAVGVLTGHLAYA